MKYEFTPIPVSQAEAVVQDCLQPLLVDLVALATNGKQAHWHVTGKTFTPIHLQLDAIVNDARLMSDTVAERAITLGIPVSGQPRSVAEQTLLEETPEGFLGADKTVEIVSNQLKTVVTRARSHLDELGDLDLVSQGIVINCLETLEKHLWMINSQF